MRNVVAPEIFRNYIRLYLKGWKNNTPVAYADLIPAGQAQYRGETGSQSSVIPFFDALLGIHDQDELQQRNLENEWKGVQEAVVAEYRDFRNYMPRGHRDFIRAVERESRVREAVKANRSNPVLTAAYNACVKGVARIRRAHKSTVPPYIGEPGEAGNLGYGTGGSDYGSTWRRCMESRRPAS